MVLGDVEFLPEKRYHSLTGLLDKPCLRRKKTRKYEAYQEFLVLFKTCVHTFLELI